MALKRHKPRQPTHLHYVVTCGACSGQFPMCGLPCFIFCPLCQIKIIFREEEE
jgi:hypothetical protein